MATLVKKWMTVGILTFIFTASLIAQAGPCTPLSPPTWITVTNLMPTSATVTWESVAFGAWYRVELKNMNSGLIEDLAITQSTYRNYSTLNPGTHYQIRIQSSTCSVGGFGASALKDFYTPTIIIDEVVNLDRTQQYPNQQVHYDSANNLIIPRSFIICVYKVPDIQNIDKLNDVFHGYIQLDNNDFFEFLLVGSQDNNVHYTFRPLAIPSSHWSVEALDENGGSQLIYSGAEAVTLIIKHRMNANSPGWVNKMTISCLGTAVVQPNTIPVFVSIADDVDFYASSNNSSLCALAAGKQTTSQSPVNNPQALKYAISPNPFTDHLDLNVLEAEAGPVTVRVLDLAGRVQFETTDSDASNGTRRIDTNTWQPGVYYLQIQTETGIKVEPVVKI